MILTIDTRERPRKMKRRGRGREGMSEGESWNIRREE